MAIEQSALQTIINHIHAQIQYETARRTAELRKPFVLGISGLQGSGKSTWANAIAQALRQQSNLKVVVVSLDDFYLDHDGLVRLRQENASNALLRTRGQPGSHDEKLIEEFFFSMKRHDRDIRIPAFDKSRFNGEGDRVPREQWDVIQAVPPVDVLIFEGWCVGFSSLPEETVRSKWAASRSRKYATGEHEDAVLSTNTLGDHALDHVLAINSNLRRYNGTFMRPSNFSYLILLDTDQLANVYRWRLDQEHALIAKTGSGMKDDEVVQFVRGYMPAYELYLDKLQKECFVPRQVEDVWRSTQLRVTLDRTRTVKAIEEMY
ncbi:uncharacterized protein PV09_02825 [Verruconis gallopava]|uniref:KAP NTPase domain-containing protein n=1 Tax=Verruconis gallopava TaxID=253628 RepID=A0A0D1Z078_9PEZI|nr:uncharacterized protein PV09_02825 [Verruconis gallopava]KIW06367.1 hypothetical protein PV09_02825 [Verruconis gallopava]